MSDEKIKIEVCCGSLDDCATAQACLADRVELIQGHQLGGLTPSYGTLELAKEILNIPIAAIVRPRMAGFCYTQNDFMVMCKDAKKFIDLGADAIVFGFLKEDSSLDSERCKKFLDIIGDRESVFHRAIDITRNPESAIEELIKLGVTRILTSGGQADCYTGRDTIKKWQNTYGNDIEILAGGGVKEQNAADLIQYTQVKQVHFSASGLFTDDSCLFRSNVLFGSSAVPPNECYIGVNKERLKVLMKQVRQ